MKIRLPKKVEDIIRRFQEHGYEAYAVGGCIRDAILHKEPEDWDITTSALPHQTKALFGRTFDTGIEHGTVTVLLGKEGFEVTTYRIDGAYVDHRRPKEVAFTGNLIEDLKRRDFTMNAMAYNHEDGLIDVFGGWKDLKQGLIRCVGEPEERFEEDALRIMRAVRFSAQLGFAIEEKTGRAAGMRAATLRDISAERIQMELVKLLVSDHPEFVRNLYELGITAVILPEFDCMMHTEEEGGNPDETVGTHTMRAVCETAPEKVLRLTMLLHDVGKPETKILDADHKVHFDDHGCRGAEKAKMILRRFRFDNETIRKVCTLVRFHEEWIPVCESAVRRSMNKIGPELFVDYLAVKQADALARPEEQRKRMLQNIAGLHCLHKEILVRKDCILLKELAVSGNDLLGIGVPKGEQIGIILQRLLALVLENPTCNTKAYLLEYTKTHF